MTTPPSGPGSGDGAATGVPTCYRHPDRETYIRCQRCGRPICPDCMRDAAVGFQCPSCVAEGAKQTRQGRTAYGGKRSADPRQTSLVLIGINVAVWILIMATGGGSSAWLDRLALLARGYCVAPDGTARTAAEQVCLVAGGTWVDGVSNGAWWELLTSAFTHVQIWHIGFNMLALWFLGPPLEAALGRARFLTLYLVSALTGSATVYWLAPEYTQTVGASGAIFGLMGALLIVAYKVGGNVQQVLFWIGLNVVFTVTGRSYISWQGHLGGFVGGLLIAAIVVYAPKAHRTAWQVGGIAALVAVTLLAVVVRTAALN
jgi:membrane associated rhomboid family serine protease